MHTDATAAEQAKTDAQTAASEAATSAGSASQSAQEAADSLQELKDGIANGDFKGEKGDPGPAVALDTTLTHEGEAADAKATGDAISGLLTEDDIAEVEALAQAYYDALDAKDKANAEEITQ